MACPEPAQEEAVHAVLRLRPPLPHGKQGALAQARDWPCPGAEVFDQVCGVESPLEEVFEAAVQPLVSATLAGCNATLFTWGSPGTGKSREVFGHPTSAAPSPCLAGMAVQQIFVDIGRLSTEYPQLRFVGVRVAALELRGVEVYDLLAEQPVCDGSVSRTRGDPLDGARQIEATQVDELLGLLHLSRLRWEERASQLPLGLLQRHCVFSVIVEAEICGRVAVGRLSLVDFSGDALDLGGLEGGLSSIAQVARSLATRSSIAPPPYAAMPFPQLMRDALGGNSRTVMLLTATCLSPTEVILSPAVLDFAAHVVQVRNRPEPNIVAADSQGGQAFLGTLCVKILGVRNRHRPDCCLLEAVVVGRVGRAECRTPPRDAEGKHTCTTSNNLDNAVTWDSNNEFQFIVQDSSAVLELEVVNVNCQTSASKSLSFGSSSSLGRIQLQLQYIGDGWDWRRESLTGGVEQGGEIEFSICFERAEDTPSWHVNPEHFRSLMDDLGEEELEADDPRVFIRKLTTLEEAALEEEGPRARRAFKRQETFFSAAALSEARRKAEEMRHARLTSAAGSQRRTEEPETEAWRHSVEQCAASTPSEAQPPRMPQGGMTLQAAQAMLEALGNKRHVEEPLSVAERERKERMAAEVAEAQRRARQERTAREAVEAMLENAARHGCSLPVDQRAANPLFTMAHAPPEQERSARYAAVGVSDAATLSERDEVHQRAEQTEAARRAIHVALEAAAAREQREEQQAALAQEAARRAEPSHFVREAGPAESLVRAAMQGTPSPERGVEREDAESPALAQVEVDLQRTRDRVASLEDMLKQEATPLAQGAPGPAALRALQGSPRSWEEKMATSPERVPLVPSLASGPLFLAKLQSQSGLPTLQPTAAKPVESGISEATPVSLQSTEAEASAPVSDVASVGEEDPSRVRWLTEERKWREMWQLEADKAAEERARYEANAEAQQAELRQRVSELRAACRERDLLAEQGAQERLRLQEEQEAVEQQQAKERARLEAEERAHRSELLQEMQRERAVQEAQVVMEQQRASEERQLREEKLEAAVRAAEERALLAVKAAEDRARATAELRDQQAELDRRRCDVQVAEAAKVEFERQHREEVMEAVRRTEVQLEHQRREEPVRADHEDEASSGDTTLCSTAEVQISAAASPAPGGARQGQSPVPMGRITALEGQVKMLVEQLRPTTREAAPVVPPLTMPPPVPQAAPVVPPLTMPPPVPQVEAEAACMLPPPRHAVPLPMPEAPWLEQHHSIPDSRSQGVTGPVGAATSQEPLAWRQRASLWASAVRAFLDEAEGLLGPAPPNQHPEAGGDPAEVLQSSSSGRWPFSTHQLVAARAASETQGAGSFTPEPPWPPSLASPEAYVTEPTNVHPPEQQRTVGPAGRAPEELNNLLERRTQQLSSAQWMLKEATMQATRWAREAEKLGAKAEQQEASIAALERMLGTALARRPDLLEDLGQSDTGSLRELHRLAPGGETRREPPSSHSPRVRETEATPTLRGPPLLGLLPSGAAGTNNSAPALSPLAPLWPTTSQGEPATVVPSLGAPAEACQPRRPLLARLPIPGPPAPVEGPPACCTAPSTPPRSDSMQQLAGDAVPGSGAWRRSWSGDLLGGKHPQRGVPHSTSKVPPCVPPLALDQLPGAGGREPPPLPTSNQQQQPQQQQQQPQPPIAPTPPPPLGPILPLAGLDTSSALRTPSPQARAAVGPGRPQLSPHLRVEGPAIGELHRASSAPQVVLQADLSPTSPGELDSLRTRTPSPKRLSALQAVSPEGPRALAAAAAAAAGRFSFAQRPDSASPGSACGSAGRKNTTSPMTVEGSVLRRTSSAPHTGTRLALDATLHDCSFRTKTPSPQATRKTAVTAPWWIEPGEGSTPPSTPPPDTLPPSMRAVGGYTERVNTPPSEPAAPVVLVGHPDRHLPLVQLPEPIAHTPPASWGDRVGAPPLAQHAGVAPGEIGAATPTPPRRAVMGGASAHAPGRPADTLRSGAFSAGARSRQSFSACAPSLANTTAAVPHSGPLTAIEIEVAAEAAARGLEPVARGPDPSARLWPAHATSTPAASAPWQQQQRWPSRGPATARGAVPASAVGPGMLAAGPSPSRGSCSAAVPGSVTPPAPSGPAHSAARGGASPARRPSSLPPGRVPGRPGGPAFAASPSPPHGGGCQPLIPGAATMRPGSQPPGPKPLPPPAPGISVLPPPAAVAGPARRLEHTPRAAAGPLQPLGVQVNTMDFGARLPGAQQWHGSILGR